MRVSVESGEGLERRLLVDIPAEPVTEAVDAKLDELKPKVRLPGFRPGKVPMRIIRQRFHQSVLEEVSRDLIESSYKEAIEQQDLKPAGSPSKLEKRDPVETGGLSYTATLEVFPEVVLQELTGQALTERQCEITAADIDDTIQTIRERHAVEKPVDRPAQSGDTLYIDFSTESADDEADHDSGKNRSVRLGTDRNMPQAVQDGLIGAVADEERTINVAPDADKADDNPDDDQPVRYTIRVLKVTEPELPTLDEGFFQSIGIKDGTEATFRQEVADNLKIELTNKLQELRRTEAFNLWLQVNPLDIPQSLVLQQAGMLREQWLDQLNIPAEQRSQLASISPKSFAPQARRQVYLGLLLSQWVKDQDVQVSEDELKAQVASHAQQYEDPESMIADSLRDSQVREQLRDQVIENKVIDWLFSQADVETEVLSFAELKAISVEPVTPEKSVPEQETPVDQDTDHA
ncbi:MAG: trigger factor [Pseudomonadota bacterium]